MKRRVRVFSPLVCLLSLPIIFITSCNPPTTTSPDNISEITVEADTCIKITIEPCLRVYPASNDEEPAPLITFENLSLEAGTLDRDYHNPWAGGTFHKEEACYLIRGTIRNNYDQGTWLAYNATGYDEGGEIVSYTLDAGAIYGVARIYINGKSTENFTLHLSWSDNVSTIKIKSRASDIMPP